MDMKKVLPPESAAAKIFGRFSSEIGGGGLAEETRRVCVLAALAACGGREAFSAELEEALDGGLAPAAAHETVLQAAAYLGFGRAPLYALPRRKKSIGQAQTVDKSPAKGL